MPSRVAKILLHRRSDEWYPLLHEHPSCVWSVERTMAKVNPTMMQQKPRVFCRVPAK